MFLGLKLKLYNLILIFQKIEYESLFSSAFSEFKSVMSMLRTVVMCVKHSRKLSNLIFKRIFFDFIFSVCFSYMYAYVLCVSPMTLESREDVRSFGIGIIDGFELPCGCWRQNLDSL